MIFTSEQSAAIDILRLGQDASVVAGPGSGKTTVLVERYRQLVEAGVMPANILAITFTEKAAANMRARMGKEFAGDPDLLSKLDRGWVSTIHGFCYRLLKQHATAAGVDPDFTILDEQLALLEQSTALREALDELVASQTAAMDRLMEATALANFEELIPPVYDAMRAAGMTPDDLVTGAGNDRRREILELARRYEGGFGFKLTPAQIRARDTTREFIEKFQAATSLTESYRICGGFAPNKNTNNAESAVLREIDERKADLLDLIFAPQRELVVEIVRRFDKRYRARKAALSKLDFNDLEFFTVRLLETHADLRAQIQKQFQQVMIDEYQDTSQLQSRLISLVTAPGRFYAVGDLNQSIYSFRHARPDVFQSHRARVQATEQHACELVENWRSRQQILDATQFLLEDAEGIERRELKGARAFTERDEPHVEAMESLRENGDDDYALEAKWIVARIAELAGSLRICDGDSSGNSSGRPARLSDFAVLVRNTAVLEEFLLAFERAGIAFNLNRRTGFLETREARDLTHLLRVINNPRDEVSTLAVLRSQFCGASDEALLALKLQRDNFGDALAFGDFSVLDGEDRARLDRFTQALAGWRESAPFIGADRLILRALDQLGIRWNPATPNGQNIEKFLGIARVASEMTLGDFVTHLAAMRKNDPRESDTPIDEHKNAVQIMTTHAAKGLEFPVVILAALDKGASSASQTAVLNFTPDFGLGIRWTFEGGPAKQGRIHLLNERKLKRTDDEEAHRLLYVACTRAEERLILSWSRKPDRNLSNWAKRVAARLEMDRVALSGEPEIRTFTARDGARFDVRLTRAGTPPLEREVGAVVAAAPEPLILERPLITGQFDPNASATALANFAACPRKYYLGPYLGWNRELVRARKFVGGRSSARAADIGTEVHQLLAGQDLPGAALESRSLAQTFESSTLGRRASKARRSAHEWEFTFALDPLIVRGSIDLWFEDARGLIIVDYKTDEVNALDALERACDYHVQVQLYALALERATGKRVNEAWVYFLRPDAPVSVALQEYEGDLTALVQRFCMAQEEIAFPMAPGAACRRCDFYRTLCPARIPGKTHQHAHA